jgi:tripartite-type tricarboxylate transporter receptor subunit TctC
MAIQFRWPAIAAALLALAGLTAPMQPARAAYPDRVIKIIVPFPPGGGADFVSRLIGDRLSKALGQAVVIDNRAGASGNTGIQAAAKSENDGYNLLITSSVFVGNPAVSVQKFYDPYKDFEPIMNFGGSPNLIAAYPKTGFKNLEDMIAYAKANPGKINYSTPGTGSLSQLGMELLALQAGIKLVHVPFRGGGPAVQAAVAGTTELTVLNIASLISLVKSGQLVGLAQTGPKRWPDLANVKTLDESGVHGANYDTYYSMFAPAGTPKPIVDRLVKELTTIMQDKEVRTKLMTGGVDPDSGGGPDQLRARIAKEVPMWEEVVKKIGFKPY